MTDTEDRDVEIVASDKVMSSSVLKGAMTATEVMKYSKYLVNEYNLPIEDLLDVGIIARILRWRRRVFSRMRGYLLRLRRMWR